MEPVKVTLGWRYRYINACILTISAGFLDSHLYTWITGFRAWARLQFCDSEVPD